MLYLGTVYSNEKAYIANFKFVAERLKRESYFDWIPHSRLIFSRLINWIKTKRPLRSFSLDITKLNQFVIQ